MNRTSSHLVPQLLFAITLLGSLLGFGVMFDRLSENIDLQPLHVEMRLLPAAEPQWTGRPR